jgi:UDP-2-acetamido-3-amino-2,3-dideoxy-glucuronate N-acetyltransferase
MIRNPSLSIAVIGAGYWGKNLVRNFHQLGLLKTICDKTQSVLQPMGQDYPDAIITDDFETVLNDPGIQGVVIAAPAALHFPLTYKALMSDKHVFVEKPLALRYEDGKKLVQLAEERKKILFVGHILQYHAAVIKLREMINNGGIGRLQYIYSRRLSLGKIRREENILWSFAPHDISVILTLVGEEPYYIDSVGSNFLHARIPDVTMTNMKFPSGIGAHIFVSWLNPFKEQRLVIIGDRAMLVFDDTQPVEEKLVLYSHVVNWRNGLPVAQKSEGKAIDLSAIWEEPLKSECRAFLHAMETGIKPLTSGEEGLRVLRILEISQHSLEQKEAAQYSPAITDHPPPITHDQYFIHPTAVIDDNVAIGKGTKIWHFSHILPGSKIGENCNIGQNVVIGPEVTIGKGCKIQNNVSIYKGITLEDEVFCGPSVVFTNVFNPRAHIRRMGELRRTLVKKGATLGANCTIICGCTIGRHAFVGAGSVVTKDIPDHALVVGNYARRVGWMCQCGEKLNDELVCKACGEQYRKKENSGLEKNS